MTPQAFIIRATLAYATGALAWVYLSDWLIAHLGGPSELAAFSTFKGIGFVAITAALFAMALARVAALARAERAHVRPIGILPTAGIILAVVVPTLVIGALVFNSASQALIRERESDLKATMDLQIEALTRHRRDSLASARTLAGSAFIRDIVGELLAPQDASQDAHLRSALGDSAHALGFSAVELWTGAGVRLLRVGDDWPPRNAVRALITTEQAAGMVKVVVRDRDRDRYGYIVAVDPAGADAGAAPAFLYLEMNPANFLYPYLARPVMIGSATQSFLVRKEADGIWHYGSPVAGATEPVMTRPLPPDLAALAEAADRAPRMAVATGASGQDVLAVARTIPLWHSVFITTMKYREVLSGARGLMLFAGLTTAAVMVVAMAIGLLFAERQKLKAALREVDQAHALAAAEERFRATFEQAAVGIVHFGLDGRITRVNLTFCTLVGYGREDLLGQHYSILTYPEDQAKDEADIADLRAGLSVDIKDQEKRIRRKEGSDIWLDVTVSLARTDDGAPSYIIAVCLDATERRAALRALKESEERFELAVRATEQGVWDIDLVTGRSYVSPRWRDMLGLAADVPVDLEAIWRERTHPAEASRVQALWEGARAGSGDAFDIECRLRHEDGSYHDFISQGFAIRGPSGQAVRIVGLTEDITERRQTERRIRLAGAVFSGTDEGIVVTDEAGFISAINPAFTAITGYEEAEVLGKSMRLLHSGRHDRAFFHQMWEELRASGSWRGEIWNRRKDGEVYLQHLIISTVPSVNGDAPRYVGVFHDITQARRSQSELDRLTHYDVLTNLPNRSLLFSLIDHAVSRAKARCAVLFVDLDHFKTVNESLGLIAGDTMLQAVGQRLRSRLSADATIGRFGGDEFVVLLEAINGADDAAAEALRIIEAFADPFAEPGGEEIYLGASVGISLYPDDDPSGRLLLQHAGSALFQAKANGRGVYSFYTGAMTAAAKARVGLEAELRRALAREELTVFFQPIVALTTGRLIGAEALVRWMSPRGLITPDQFIPLAEETGLIVPLGEYVAQRACRQLVQWDAEGVTCGMISVNLSPRQFSQADLCARYAQILKDSGLSPERLEVEITESLLISEGVAARSKLNELSAMGVKVAVDDFGTGYSSLSYLKRFPIGKLKIDKSFVRDLPGSAVDGEIVRAVIAIGRALNLAILAEGVETEAQRDFLKENGCAFGQGFLWSRPVPADDFAALVRAWPRGDEAAH
ncbi:sensor domain-containing protein [Xanthobacter tagetidis]|uniref:EAL domain-containing protein n=1 Tax=Xanthobacter tagetidis TaxID=60216 RepID=A0A3L7AFN7_9HYPH|nr:EAL domain-containing protein [Xanthobacter tagetidis]MBB6305931.1 diguanylate cyclase (GGDEF)-like protein/PAS domain S-box-containing protein [Xanthobacter tagetidis]RLP78451.1 EAL domain-containing protein [Xanthobacter tagetidis]